MSQTPSEIPRPTPLRDQPFPEIPAHLTPTPSPLGVTTGTITGHLELGIALKVTYRLKGSGQPQLAEEQIPLSLANRPHDELVPGGQPSMKEVPEVLAYSSGTDLIVRAHARPPHPVAGMKVGVVVGNLRHYAKVSGVRYVDREGDRLVFTPPEPFEAMPLRYELAYGGVDQDFESMVAESAKGNAKPEDLRRISAVAKDFLRAVPPVAYPRNTYGKGYAMVADEQTIVGKELPNIELAEDRLTPDRLWPSDPLRWMEMPVPAGFDYMDVGLFPRTAMMGLPPMAEGNMDQIPEVLSGQVPAGFCRGNMMYAEREEIPGLIHPELARCAPIGLRLPFLRGDERITLYGMDPAEPVMGVHLPGIRPVFHLPQWGPSGRDQELDSQLYHTFVDVDERLLSLVWSARIPWLKPLKPGEDQEIASRIRVRNLHFGPSTI
ncbi:MAG: DUF2169 domain-containing protein [Gemmatimonadota bacterium]